MSGNGHQNTKWRGWHYGTAKDPERGFVTAFVKPNGIDLAPFFLPNRIIPVESWSRPRPTLSVDLDNVIRDQIGAIIAATQRRYRVTLQRESFSIWDPPLGQIIGVDNDEFTAWAWGDPMIFALAEPMAGALAALSRLAAEYRIMITTSTACPELTEPWLRWWQVPYHEIIHTTDKGSVEFDWHIDDSPSTLQKLAAAGRQVVRFRLPWNEGLNELPTLDGWNLIQEVLE